MRTEDELFPVHHFGTSKIRRWQFDLNQFCQFVLKVCILNFSCYNGSTYIGFKKVYFRLNAGEFKITIVHGVDSSSVIIILDYDNSIAIILENN